MKLISNEDVSEIHNRFVVYFDLIALKYYYKNEKKTVPINDDMFFFVLLMNFISVIAR